MKKEINNEIRELKSVYMQTNAYLVKLVLHGVHKNKANVFNQVSLLAINFLGVPFTSHDNQPIV